MGGSFSGSYLFLVALIRNGKTFASIAAQFAENYGMFQAVITVSQYRQGGDI